MDTQQPAEPSPAGIGGYLRALGVVAVCGFLALVLIAAVALITVGRALEESREARDAVARHRDVLEQIQLVLTALLDAETGQRGYIITGDPAFLEPYAAARRDIDVQLEALEGLLDAPESRRILGNLSTAAREQLDLYMQFIETRKERGFAVAAALVSQQTGKRRMDAMRGMVGEIRGIEENGLRDRLAADFASAERSENLIQWLLAGSGLIALLIGALLLRDIAMRQRAERSLSLTNALLHSTMNSINQGIGVFDAKQRLVAWNPRYSELRRLEPGFLRTGTTLVETLKRGHMFRVRDLETNTERSMPSAGRDIAGFHMQPLLLELSADDGQVLEARGQPTADGYYVFTYTDITALKRSEHAYRDRATRLTSTLDAVVDAIITINESGSIESWSKGAERMFGYPAEEVIRRNIGLIMPEVHAAAHDSHLRRYLTTGEKHAIGQRREMEARHRDGRTFPVDLGISEMWLDERRLFIGVVRDITERREVERMKNEFISTVSHELRTPLTSIAGALGLLSGGVVGQVAPKVRRLIDIARQNSDRLVRLINDILDLEKAESGQLDFQLEKESLAPIVATAVDANRGFGDARQVALELHEGAEGFVRVDRDRLIQVITNLLSNAIKFSPAGGTVRVSIGEAGESLTIAVRDEGPGIPLAFRSRIFQKFAQADNSDTREKGGTGLGLWIAQAITERLGGRIGYECPPGGGTIFTVSLPRWRDTADEVVALAPLGGVRVLICEDDPDIARVLLEMLGKHTVHSTVAATAQAARDLLAHEPFDVALIDLNLPDGDGLELIASLRATPECQHLPVIVMTARPGQAQPELLHALQLADWLSKPVDQQRLMSAIHLAIIGDPKNHYRVLHVEDDPSLVQMVRAMLDSEAAVTNARSLAEARRWLGREQYDLVILDIRLPDGSGLDLLPQLRGQAAAATPVVLFSANEASRDVAAEVEAALVKSRHSLDELLVTVRRLARKDRKANPEK